ncbi:hypothetical protein GWG54_11020 [Natronococcus sp. JC468]|uniref:hypothetical protein n=1 Tax=Natronococcus sp. JC468 TaxID=1961921 RepID=UPI00143BA27B|nr:hypothetical protein [Natronococcus sp. JC468]NKE36340.1 hypothetical protein [Natronococcus sp. JC468]
MRPEEGRMVTGETKAEIEDDVEIVYEGTKIQKSFGVSDIIQFSLMMGGNIASGVIATWLYNQLKDREVALEIEGEEVEVDEESIQTKLDEFRE